MLTGLGWASVTWNVRFLHPLSEWRPARRCLRLDGTWFLLDRIGHRWRTWDGQASWKCLGCGLIRSGRSGMSMSSGERDVSLSPSEAECPEQTVRSLLNE